jgi:hypothetical protein
LQNNVDDPAVKVLVPSSDRIIQLY